MSVGTVARARTPTTNRWLQLILGIVCMASVANLQYGWTLFVLPIQHQWGWTKAEIQIAFSIFIILETWLVPFEGLIVDRIGPRWMVLAGLLHDLGKVLCLYGEPQWAVGRQNGRKMHRDWFMKMRRKRLDHPGSTFVRSRHPPRVDRHHAYPATTQP